MRFKFVRLRRNEKKAPFLIWKGKVDERALGALEMPAKFIAQAVRLGKTEIIVRIYPANSRVEPPSVEEGKVLRRLIEKKVVEEVLKGAEVPLLRGHKVWVPGWAFWALDAISPEARELRQAAFEAWWESFLRVFLEAKDPGDDKDLEELLALEEEALRRIEWAHGEGREPTSRDYLLARFAQEEEAERRARERVLPPAPRLTEVEAALEVAVHEGLWKKDFPYATPFYYAHQVGPAAPSGVLEPFLPIFRFLEEVGWEWPTLHRFQTGGVSPLFWVIWMGIFEKKWADLAHRIGTDNPTVLKRARALQRALGNGVPAEEALQALFGEEAREWTWLLDALAPSLDVTLLGEWEEESAEREYDPEGDAQKRALLEALEILGVSAEEALENPEIQGEVKELALALLMDPDPVDP